jgi:hypothetical protein
MLLEDEIDSLFMGEDKTKQKALGEFM